MRNFIVAFLAFIMLLMFVPPAPAQAQPVVSCDDIVVGQTIRIVCQAAGVVVLNTTVNLPVVEIPVPGPTATETVRVTLPGETRTIRVPVAGPTITLPGQPGATVTQPGSTATVTKEPKPVRVTETPDAAPRPPRATVTETVTVNPSPDRSRQPATDPGTIVEDDDNSVVKIPEIELSPPEAVGLGLGAIIGLVLLLLLGMWAGYYMGYKDSDKAEAKFLKSLLRR